MRSRAGAPFAIAGVAVALLALVFTGILARPLLAAGGGLVAFALLGEARKFRGRVRVVTDRRRTASLLAGFLVLGLVGFWAAQPFLQRRAILGRLEAFSAEGRQIESDFTERLAAPDRLQGDYTGRVQDWHHRIEAWVGEDLGMFYKSRLATPRENPTYPAGMPARLKVFWDILETDLAAMDRFRQEFSHWLYSAG